MQLRVLAAAASKELGQPIVVETRAGAAGTVGPSSLLSAQPDGYTLSMATGVALLRQPFIQATRYDPAKDFSYVIGVTRFELGLAVRSDAPWRNLAEFIADAKRNPGKLAYGTAGCGHRAAHRDAASCATLRASTARTSPTKDRATSSTPWRAATSRRSPRPRAGRRSSTAASSGCWACTASPRLKRWPNAPTSRSRATTWSTPCPGASSGPRAWMRRSMKALHDAFQKATVGRIVRQDAGSLGQEPWGLGLAGATVTTWCRASRSERDLVAKYRLKER